MSRTINQTPRHLDDPLKLGPLTLAQWAVAVVAVFLVWLVLTQLAFLPVIWRFVVGSAVVGIALGLTEGDHGRGLWELPRRGWHSLVSPREYIAGAPRHGPLTLTLMETRPLEEDPPDA